MIAAHFTAPTLMVAIDFSKHRHEVLISIPGKQRRRRLTSTNTLADFEHLAEGLASYDLLGISDLFLRTVRAAAARTLCSLWKRPLLDGKTRLGELNRASG